MHHINKINYWLQLNKRKESSINYMQSNRICSLKNRHILSIQASSKNQFTLLNLRIRIRSLQCLSVGTVVTAKINDQRTVAHAFSHARIVALNLCDHPLDGRKMSWRFPLFLVNFAFSSNGVLSFIRHIFQAFLILYAFVTTLFTFWGFSDYLACDVLYIYGFFISILRWLHQFRFETRVADHFSSLAYELYLLFRGFRSEEHPTSVAGVLDVTHVVIYVQPATITDDMHATRILWQDDPAAVACDLERAMIRVHSDNEPVAVEPLDTVVDVVPIAAFVEVKFAAFHGTVLVFPVLLLWLLVNTNNRYWHSRTLFNKTLSSTRQISLCLKER